MGWILGSGLRFGRLVIALAIGLLVIGIAQLRSAPVDVYPEFMPPSVEVQTEALGLSAAEVEQLITVPLEQDLLNGVPWLDTIHSSSMPGLSAIDLTFQPGTNLYAARQMVQERMTQAHALPNVGSPPIMIQPLASVSRIAMIRLSSRQVSLIDMSVLARWKIRPRLMGVHGVANVAIYGQRDRQLQVQVDPRQHAGDDKPVNGVNELITCSRSIPLSICSQQPLVPDLPLVFGVSKRQRGKGRSRGSDFGFLILRHPAFPAVTGAGPTARARPGQPRATRT